MAGSIWKLENLAEEGSPHQGDQAGYDAAKAVVEAAGGILQVGPGLEGLAFGVFVGNKTVFIQTTNTGEYRVTGLRLADAIDPTKRVFFDPSGISAGVQRTIVLPNWGGVLPVAVDAGVAGRFLRCNEPGQPTWESLVVQNNLLDGANHLDTVAQAALRGALIYGDATPKWNRLAVGAADTFLGSDGTDVSWKTAAAIAAIVGAALEHNTLLHLKPFQVVGNVTINNGSDLLTDAAAGGRFANVRVGDRINLSDAHYHPTLFGMYALTSGVADPNQIQVSRTNTSGGNITGATATVIPGDHFDTTLLEGLLPTGGLGTFDQPLGGTVPVQRGSIDFEGYSSGASPRWTFWGATNTGNNNGFNLKKRGAAIRCWFHIENMTVTRWVSMPNLTANDTFVFVGQAQTLLSKILSLGCKAEVDGTNGRFCLQSGGGADRVLPDVSLMTAARNQKYPDYAGIYRVDGAEVTFANGDTTPSVAGSRVFQTNNAGATTITAFDDGADGIEIIIRGGDANTTFQHAGGGTLRCEGGLNQTLGVDDIIRFVRIGGVWYQSAPVVVI